MERGEIVDLLTDLGGRLAARGVVGEMYIVGGAAIALAFDERRSTRDIDAVSRAEDADLPGRGSSPRSVAFRTVG